MVVPPWSPERGQGGNGTATFSDAAASDGAASDDAVSDAAVADDAVGNEAGAGGASAYDDGGDEHRAGGDIVSGDSI